MLLSCPVVLLFLVSLLGSSTPIVANTCPCRYPSATTTFVNAWVCNESPFETLFYMGDGCNNIDMPYGSCTGIFDCTIDCICEDQVPAFRNHWNFVLPSATYYQADGDSARSVIIDWIADFNPCQAWRWLQPQIDGSYTWSCFQIDSISALSGSDIVASNGTEVPES